MPKLDQILNLIEDGEWHSLKELSKHSKIPKQKLTALSKLLSETNIVEYKTKENNVRIKPEWKKMLKNTHEQKSQKAAVGTIVLPPKKSLTIQGIQLTNLTEKELEISMRAKEKLEELAISTVDQD